MDEATVDIFGDTLSVHWTGSVWTSPCNGQQHTSVRAAMRAEVRRYYSDCGDDPDDDDINEEIEGYLDNIEYP